jgi:hypothetical protein
LAVAGGFEALLLLPPSLLLLLPMQWMLHS